MATGIVIEAVSGNGVSAGITVTETAKTFEQGNRWLLLFGREIDGEAGFVGDEPLVFRNPDPPCLFAEAAAHLFGLKTYTKWSMEWMFPADVGDHPEIMAWAYMRTLPNKLRWLDYVIAAMIGIGNPACGIPIEDLTRRVLWLRSTQGIARGANDASTIRMTMPKNCRTMASWEGIHDLFINTDSGIWRLRTHADGTR